MRNARTIRRLACALGFVALIATACGSDDTGTVTGSTPTTAAAVSTTAAAAPTTAAATSSGALAGTWGGEYTQTKPSDAKGTFGVTFDGSAPDYTGSITIAGTCDPSCPITAKVTGTTISFGAIGSYAITYSGTISGTSMSGTYTAGAGQYGTAQYEGTWKAVKA